MTHLFRFTSLSVSSALLLTTTLAPAIAQDLSILSTGTLRIEQQSPNGIFGSWTLIKPGNIHHTGNTQGEDIPELQEGHYTLIADPPHGAQGFIHVFNHENLAISEARPQASFDIQEGDAFRIVIEYMFSRVGTVSVNSDPPGMAFKMIGPNGEIYEGITPESYLKASEGQYTVDFAEIEGCITPKRNSLLLTKDGRINFSMTIKCDVLAKVKERLTPEHQKFVTVTIDKAQVTLRDVPQSAWFAAHVFAAAKLGIISGYKDDDGNPTGLYGPEDPVTVAQLAKIAHRIGGIVEGSREPKNPKARLEWFSPFVASAEEHGWTIFNDATIDPFRPATRGEVLVTLLQVLDVPLKWPKGSLFTDVSVRTSFASAIETAAADGVVSGHTDSEGKALGTFGPEEPINRAELAKVLSLALEVYGRSK